MTCLAATISPQYQHRLLSKNGRLQPLHGYCRVGGEHRQDGWCAPVGATHHVPVPPGMRLFEAHIGIDDQSECSHAEFLILDENDQVLARHFHLKGLPALSISVPVRGNQIRLITLAKNPGYAIWFAPRFTDEASIVSLSGHFALALRHDIKIGNRALVVTGKEIIPQKLQKALHTTQSDVAFWITPDSDARDDVTNRCYVIQAQPFVTAPSPCLNWCALSAPYCLNPQYESIFHCHTDILDNDSLHTVTRLQDVKKNINLLYSPQVVPHPNKPLTLREVLRWKYSASEEEMDILGITPAMASQTDLKSFEFWSGKKTSVLEFESAMKNLFPKFHNWAVADKSLNRFTALPIVASCLLSAQRTQP